MDREMCARIGVLVLAVQMLERRVAALEGVAPMRPAPPVGRVDLRALLRERGWTQKTLADRSGLSATNVNRWLLGEHRMPVEAAVAIARALGVSVESLWG